MTKNLSQLPLRNTDFAGRLSLLQQAGLLQGDVEQGYHLMGAQSLLELGDCPSAVENCVGMMPMSVGLATNVRVNGVEMLVPLATEERGIVAGVSKAAKLCLPEGFSAETDAAPRMRGQVLFSGYRNRAEVEDVLVGLKGGLGWAVQKILRAEGYDQDDRPTLSFHVAASDDTGIVVNFAMNTGERMGAATVTRMAERLARELEPTAGRRRTAAICSNADAGWQVVVRAVWPKCQVSDETVKRIMDLQKWAENDEFRAPTHNKGIMNAVSAVALATGQDSRAVEMSAHVSAMRQRGGYGPLTRYKIGRDGIEGSMTVRLPVGVAGGATENPFARMYRAIAGIRDSHDLACVMGVAGLAANFAALLCLQGEGIPAAGERLRNA